MRTKGQYGWYGSLGNNREDVYSSFFPEYIIFISVTQMNGSAVVAYLYGGMPESNGESDPDRQPW